MVIDLEGKTADELRAVIAEATAALERLEAIEAARIAVGAAVEAYASAAGLSLESAWRQLFPYSVEVPPEPDPEAYPAWTQPAGAHDSYALGATVTYQGAVYESTIAGNAWSPAAYPQGWRKL